MSDLKQLQTKISVEDYLEGEELAEVRHEYVGGEVYAMAGGTLNHNMISGNIFAVLHEFLGANTCRPFISDVKVRVQTLESESFYYPDVVVTCDADDKGPLVLERPTTIIEVLSDSTERIDRSEKFLAYRSLSSLQDYVLVSQKEKRIAVARRVDGWQAEVLMGDDFLLNLACCETPIESARIYRNVDFSVTE